MSCGRLWGINDENNGSGSRSIVKPVRLSAWRSVHARKQRHGNSGPRFQGSIGNVPSAIPIFGRRTRLFYPQNAIVPSEKRADKRITSNGSTIPCANDVVDSSAKRCRSQKNWRTMSVRSGTLSMTITRSNAPNAVSLPLHDYPHGNIVRASQIPRVLTVLGEECEHPLAQTGC